MWFFLVIFSSLLIDPIHVCSIHCYPTFWAQVLRYKPCLVQVTRATLSWRSPDKLCFTHHAIDCITFVENDWSGFLGCGPYSARPLTSLMKSPMSPGCGAADLTGYCGSGCSGLSSSRLIPTGLMVSGSTVSGCWSWLRS